MINVHIFEYVPAKPMRRLLSHREIGTVTIAAETKEEAIKKLKPPAGYHAQYIGSQWKDEKGLHLESEGEEVILPSSKQGEYD